MLAMVLEPSSLLVSPTCGLSEPSQASGNAKLWVGLIASSTPAYPFRHRPYGALAGFVDFGRWSCSAFCIDFADWLKLEDWLVDNAIKALVRHTGDLRLNRWKHFNCNGLRK